LGVNIFSVANKSPLLAVVPDVKDPCGHLDNAMDDEQKQQQEDWLNSRKNRLPSFTEVLSRRTRPPVDLFMF